MSKPERIAATREAIALVEREKCHCTMCAACRNGDSDCEECGGRGISRKCTRCEHLASLDAQLQEAEGRDA